jgi:putative ABC transport system substrate-binding protein
MSLRRRAVAGLAAGIAALPFGAFAQARAAGVARIGILPLGSASSSYDQSLVDAFRQGLRESGLVEGRDVALDIVWVTEEADYPKAANELVQRGAQVLVPAGTSASVAAKRHAQNTAIVFVTVGDPIGVGLVDNLAHPAANVTGFSDVLLDLSGKFVELAKALGEPGTPVSYLWYTGWANGQQRFEATQAAARSSGIALHARPIAHIGEASEAIAALKREGAQSLIIQPSPFTYLQRKRLVEIAAGHGLGTIFGWPVAAREGALMAYGPDYAVLYRGAGAYAARILKGARPGDLPVVQPTKVDLVINLRAARSLGVPVPHSVIVGATEVIV